MNRERDRTFVEECWTLVGHRRGRIWHARRQRPTVGWPSAVAFDAAWALAREERRGDVVGFVHTHPSGFLRPSRRDVRTMRAWCGAFGKPLLCVILAGPHAAGYRFDDEDDAENEGDAVAAVELFPRGVLIAIERACEGSDDHGDEQAAPRGAVPRRRQTGEAARRAGRALRGRCAGLEPRR